MALSENAKKIYADAVNKVGSSNSYGNGSVPSGTYNPAANQILQNAYAEVEKSNPNHLEQVEAQRAQQQRSDEIHRAYTEYLAALQQNQQLIQPQQPTYGTNNNVIKGVAGIGENFASGFLGAIRDTANWGRRTAFESAEDFRAADKTTAEQAYYDALYGANKPVDTRTAAQRELDEFMGISTPEYLAAKASDEQAKANNALIENDIAQRGVPVATNIGRNYEQEVAERYSDMTEGWQKTQRIAATVGQQIPAQAMRFLDAALPGLGTALSSGVFMASADQGAYEQALSEGATHEGAQRYGALIGTIESATELLGEGFAKVLKIAKVSDVPFTELYNTALTRTVKSNLINNVFGLLAEMNSEGIEEVVADLVEPFAKSVYNEKTGLENWRDDVTLQTLWEDYLGGAIAGGIMAGVGGVAKGTFRAQNEARASAAVQQANERVREAKTALSDARTDYGKKSEQAKNARGALKEARQTAAQTYSDVTNYAYARGNRLDSVNRTRKGLWKTLSDEEAKRRYGDAESLKELIAESEALNPGNTLAERLSNKLEAKKDISGKEIRTLLRQNDTDIRNLEVYGGASGNEAVSETENTTPKAAAETPVNGSPVVQTAAAPMSIAEFANSAERGAQAMQNAITRANAQREQTASAAVETAEKNSTAATEKSSAVPATVSKTERVASAEEKNEAPVTPESASKKYGAQAQAFVHTYQEGQDVAKFDRAYSTAREYGIANVPLSVVKGLKSVSYMTEAQIENAYAAGRDAAKVSISEQNSKNGVNGSKVIFKRSGTVRFDGGNMEDLRKTFNDKQGVAYRILSRIAEATGVNIVLYKSLANENGKFTEAEGRFSRDNDTIYIDVNAGLTDISDVGKMEKYTMLRTFSHEFTHFLQKWNPEMYDTFRGIVFEEMNKRLAERTKESETPLTVEDLINRKLDTYRKQIGSNFTVEQASDEVLADAMTDILPDSRFMEQLYNENRTLAEKLVEQLKKFLADIKRYFAGLSPNAKLEADVLKENIDGTVKYVQSIVDAFDKLAVGAVDNYQASIANEEKSDIKEHGGKTQYEIREGNSQTKYEEYISINKQLAEVSAKQDELEDSAEYNAIFNRITSASTDEEKTAAIEELAQWQNESGYGDVVKRGKELAAEARRLYQEYSDARNNELVTEQQEKIRKRGLSEEEFFRSEAVKEFGYTPYFYDAGYILPNGKMLNFSGEKGKHYGSRGQDHRAIGTIFAEEMSGSEAMVRFMHQGNIRIMAETPGVDIASKSEPSASQYNTISKFISAKAKEEYFSVDFTDERGYTVGNLEYEGRVSPSRVINDIKRYYQTGETNQSTVAAFHNQYSIRDGAVDEIKKAISDKNYGGDIQLTDTTPGILLEQKGVKNLPLVEKASHIRENILTKEEAIALGLKNGEDIHYHGLGVPLYTKVIDDLDTVSLAYRGARNADNPSRRENYFLLISQHKNSTGDIINVPVVINQKRDVNQVFIDANLVATVFGREDFYAYISEELKKGNLVRIKRKGVTNSEPPEQTSVDYTGNASATNSTSNRMESQDQFSLRDSEGNELSAVQSFSKEREAAKLYNLSGQEYFDAEIELYKPYQRGTANKDNFFRDTVAEFKRVSRRPSRAPDYVSRSRDGSVSSEYWYTDEGVIRGSSHWGLGIRSCDWKLEGVGLREDSVTGTNKLYGYAKWTDFILKTQIVGEKKNADGVYRDFSDARLTSFADDNAQYQLRESNLSNVDILVSAAAAVQNRDAKYDWLNDGERDALRIFAERAKTLRDAQQKRLALLEEKRALQESKDTRERGALTRVQNNLDTVNGMIKRAEEDLAKVENTRVIKNVLKQARTIVEKDTRQRGIEELQAYKNRRNDTEGARKYRKQIADTAKTLSEWLQKNSDKEHVPEVLKQPLAELLSSIDFSSKRFLNGGEMTNADKKFRANLTVLKELIENQQKAISGEDGAVDNVGAYLDISEENREFLTEIGNAMASVDGTYTINRMTAEQLKDFSKFLKNLATAIRKANKALANARYENIPAMAQSSIQHFEALGNAADAEGKPVSRFIKWTNATPYYAFRRFGEAGEALFDGLTKGWETLAYHADEIINNSKKTYRPEEAKKWREQVRSITLEDGSRIQMTTAQIMELSQLVKREQAMKHITKGGIRIGNFETKDGTKQNTTHYHLSAADLNNIIGLLTERQRKVADSLQSYMATRGREWGNEISMARFGYEFYDEGENYYPIRTDGSARPMQDTDQQNNSMFRLLNLSASKSLNPKASNALIVGDIFATYSDHMADMAKLNALGLPILDAIKWFNYTERTDNEDGTYDVSALKKSMEKAFGTSAESYFRTLIKDINGTSESGDRGGNLAGKLMSNYKIAAVGANIRVALLQPTSIVRAMYVLKPKYILSSFFSKGAYQEALKYSGTAMWKNLGYYDTDISKSMRGQIENTETVGDKIKDKTMVLAEKGDQFTWGKLWTACKMQAKAQNRSLSGEELKQATAELFRKTIYATQVMDSTLTRSEMMRSRTKWNKIVTAFMAEPTLSYNLMMDCTMQYTLDKKKYGKAKAWQRNKSNISLATITYVASAALAAFAESLWDAFRDDDDYETFMQKFRQAFLGEGKIYDGNFAQDLTVIGKIPVIKDILATMRGQKSSDISVASVESITNAFNIWKETIQLATGKLEKPTDVTYYGKMTPWGKIYKSLQALSQLTGFAVSNMTRDVSAIWNTIVGGFAPNMKIRTYANTKVNQIKYSYQDGYLSEEKAIAALIEAGEAKTETEAKKTIFGWQDGGAYGAVYDALQNGGDVNAAVKEMTENGYKRDDVIGRLKGKIGELYKGTDDNAPSITESQAKTYLTKYCGMTADDAAKRVGEWKAKRETGYAPSEISEALVDGDITRSEAESYWQKYGGKSAGEARVKADSVIYGEKYPDWDTGSIEGYLKKYDELGKNVMDKDKFLDSCYVISKTKGFDADGDGETDKYSVQNNVIAYIAGLNISAEAKDALFLTKYAASSLKKTPWH